MSIADISRDNVLDAMAEYDDLGREKFLGQYGFRASLRYFVVESGSEYDSKALLGVAHKYATGVPLRAAEFSGGEATVVAKVKSLGFAVHDRRPKASKKKAVVVRGEIDGVPEGTTFVDRQEASDRGVHRNPQGGIVGNRRDGAESIVVSGGYEDDEDYGDEITYTGEGGRGENGQQIADQTFASNGNAALQTSALFGTPVRVIRGNKATGCSYDGLFRVEESWLATGRSGFTVCRFRLTKFRPDDLVEVKPVAPVGNAKPVRRTTEVQRVVRNTAVADFVKQIHDHTCQLCGIRLTVQGRGYSEGAHIRALGRPHNGPDESENVLCLCPNCHVRFDHGEVVLQSDLSFTLDGTTRQLAQHPDHVVKQEHVDYHRARHG
ncbi:YDG/SRA domain-containing protein [Amycolatopsis sp. 195334CR]|uniref:YDG/SRA domain-containing protein n=1 Tax=Amycolatopsis sp. 195334CR TaxID=2814588 RepID=UPI001A8C2239|nr:YDG/SRA domain-containing protein [Amycolatopsis sp. 195334CR]MBN6035284.1 HNH endonuclease [Amycolatopsis sp. 195334CR]